MRNLLLTVATVLLSTLAVFATGNGNMEVFNENCSFYAPGQGTFIETYFLIPAAKLKFVPVEGGYQAAVNVTLMYHWGNEIAAYDKYTLNSAVITDTNKLAFSLVDQKRISLGEGVYLLEASFEDANEPEDHLHFEKKVFVNFKEGVFLSDIQLVDEFTTDETESIFTKGGVNMTPFVNNFYPANANVLRYYSEVYNSDLALGEDFLIKMAVLDENAHVIGNLSKHQKAAASPVVPAYGSFNIEKLPSGNYYLSIEVLNQQNELVANRTLFFQRLNPNYQVAAEPETVEVENTFVEAYDLETLQFYLSSLLPIATQVEQNSLIGLSKGENLEELQKYFLAFWTRRNQLNPKAEWQAYVEKLKFVDYNYATSIEEGFETDRGRIYLKNGEPNDVNKAKEPGSVAYEIWHYYSLEDGQTDVKYVFANVAMVPNTFDLIHSTARGEIYNPQWQYEIYDGFSGPQGGNGLDNTQFRDYFGGDLNDYYGQ